MIFKENELKTVKIEIVHFNTSRWRISDFLFLQLLTRINIDFRFRQKRSYKSIYFNYYNLNYDHLYVEHDWYTLKLIEYLYNRMF